LAVGLGIGAAAAHTPVASADSSTDWLSSIDSLLGGSALPAPASGLDLAISFDGTSLFQEGTANAYSGNGDFAIAYGDGATATADGGTGDYALADGTNALANAGSLTGTGDNYDSAVDIGNNVDPSTYPGAPDGAYAGAGSLIGGTDSGTNSYDSAIDIGNNGVSTDTSFPGDGGNSGAFAGDGSLIGSSGDGNYDTALNFGNLDGFGLGPASVDGNYDIASDSGNATGTNIGALAGFGNDDIATVIGGTSTATAGGGYDGPLSNFDLATVFDATGTDGSYADAGALSDVAGNYDFAGAFGDDLNALAQGADYLFTVLPSLF
jgi:hypothetical protein